MYDKKQEVSLGKSEENSASVYITIRIKEPEEGEDLDKISIRDFEIYLSVSEFNDKSSLFAVLFNRINNLLKNVPLDVCLKEEGKKMRPALDPEPHHDTMYRASYLLEVKLPMHLKKSLNKPAPFIDAYNHTRYDNVRLIPKNYSFQFNQLERLTLQRVTLEQQVNVYSEQPESVLDTKEVAVFKKDKDWFYLLPKQEEPHLIDLSEFYSPENKNTWKYRLEDEKDRIRGAKFRHINGGTRTIDDCRDVALHIVTLTSLDGFTPKDLGIKYHFTKEIYNLLPLINKIIPIIQGSFQKDTKLSMLPTDLLHFILSVAWGDINFPQPVFHKIYDLIQESHNKKVDLQPGLSNQQMDNQPSPSLICSKTEVFVFLKFTSRQVARDFIEQYPGIPKVWDPKLGKPLNKLDPYRVPDACIVRLPIQYKGKPFYETFSQEHPELNLPKVDEILKEPTSYKPRQHRDPKSKIIDKLEQYIDLMLDQHDTNIVPQIKVAKKILRFLEEGTALSFDEEDVNALQNKRLAKITADIPECQEKIHDFNENKKQDNCSFQ